MLQLSPWLKEGCCSLGSEVFVEKALGLRVQIVKNVSDSWEFQRKSLVEFSQVWGDKWSVLVGRKIQCGLGISIGFGRFQGELLEFRSSVIRE